MWCKKLTNEEHELWTTTDEVPYEESPLKDLMPEEAYDAIVNIRYAAAVENFAWMHQEISCNSIVLARNEDNPEVHRIIARAYEHAVACGDADSCCNLANMYHNTKNQGSAEDYAKAVELYELGADRGNSQSSVNLGYIYYYGRGCAVDYTKAYECFARGVLLDNNPEGFWKLGDLYAGGKGVRQSDYMAWTLYSRAYEHAKDSAYGARAAHHMADYLMTGIEGHLEANPDRALALYAEAELSYYKLIDHGLTYYQAQLEQCIEGQMRARELVQQRHAKIRAGEEE